MNIIDEVRALVEGYSDMLAEKGIGCTVSKKYFESDVSAVYNGVKKGLLNHIDEHISRRKERKYKYQPNSCNCIVLKFYPVEKTNLKKDNCKEYSFILSQKWRGHIGEEPIYYHKSNQILLSKIEKRLNNTIKKSAKTSCEQACKNNIIDIIRYLFSVKYGYMKHVDGKDRTMLDIAAMILIVIIVLLFVLIIGLICHK